MINEYNKFIKGLNNLLSTLDCSYNINMGGCAFVAAVLAREFERANYKYIIVGADNGWVTYNFYDKGHFYIKCGNFYINQSYFTHNIVESNFDSHHMFEFYYDDFWNLMYDIKHNGRIAGLIRWYFTNNCPKYKSTRL